MTTPTKIQLTEAQAAQLLAAGAVFAIIGRTSHPAPPGAMTLWAIPCTVAAGDAACSVAKGEARAVRLATTPTTLRGCASHRQPCDAPTATLEALAGVLGEAPPPAPR